MLFSFEIQSVPGRNLPPKYKCLDPVNAVEWKYMRKKIPFYAVIQSTRSCSTVRLGAFAETVNSSSPVETGRRWLVIYLNEINKSVGISKAPHGSPPIEGPPH